MLRRTTMGENLKVVLVLIALILVTLFGLVLDKVLP